MGSLSSNDKLCNLIGLELRLEEADWFISISSFDICKS